MMIVVDTDHILVSNRLTLCEDYPRQIIKIMIWLIIALHNNDTQELCCKITLYHNVLNIFTILWTCILKVPIIRISPFQWNDMTSTWTDSSSLGISLIQMGDIALLLKHESWIIWRMQIPIWWILHADLSYSNHTDLKLWSACHL